MVCSCCTNIFDFGSWIRWLQFQLTLLDYNLWPYLTLGVLTFQFNFFINWVQNLCWILFFLFFSMSCLRLFLIDSKLLQFLGFPLQIYRFIDLIFLLKNIFIIDVRNIEHIFFMIMHDAAHFTAINGWLHIALINHVVVHGLNLHTIHVVLVTQEVVAAVFLAGVVVIVCTIFLCKAWWREHDNLIWIIWYQSLRIGLTFVFNSIWIWELLFLLRVFIFIRNTIVFSEHVFSFVIMRVRIFSGCLWCNLLVKSGAGSFLQRF